MPHIVRVRRCNGRETPVDLELLESFDLSSSEVKRGDDWILSEFQFNSVYYDPGRNLEFAVRRTVIQYRGPRPGDTFKHPLAGQEVSFEDAYEIAHESGGLASPNEDRDRFIYDQTIQGKTDKQIRDEIKKQAKEKGWTALGAVQSIGQARDRYCQNKGLKLIRKRSNRK